MPDAARLPAPPGAVGARMIGFVDHMRMNGFKAGIGEALDLIAYFGSHPPDDPSLARRKMKIMLSRGREDWDRFDDLFEAYWFARGKRREKARTADRHAGSLSASGHGVWREHLGSGGEDAAGAPRVEAPAERDVDADAPGRLVASGQAVRSRTDLRKYSDPREIAEAERLAWQLASAMRYRLSRRYRRRRNGRRLDLRRTIRANLARGGEPIELVRKSRADRPVRVVVFLDVSGSMESYSRFFLQFVKGLVCAWIDADAYLLHTRLIRVTDVLGEKDSIKAMTRLSLLADGFGGGTRLGACLRSFNDGHARRAINSRTVVVILSDGYDTGPADLLAGELARLKRRARRLVWLNPLLGWRGYEPVNAAMQAAMPHIDVFSAANTLDSLASVEDELARM